MSDLDKDIDIIETLLTRWMIDYAPTPLEPVAVAVKKIRNALTELNDMRSLTRKIP